VFDSWQNKNSNESRGVKDAINSLNSQRLTQQNGRRIEERNIKVRLKRNVSIEKEIIKPIARGKLLVYLILSVIISFSVGYFLINSSLSIYAIKYWLLLSTLSVVLGIIVLLIALLFRK
jgi:Na+/melibiose symporter-like transporter